MHERGVARRSEGSRPLTGSEGYTVLAHRAHPPLSINHQVLTISMVIEFCGVRMCLPIQTSGAAIWGPSSPAVTLSTTADTSNYCLNNSPAVSTTLSDVQTALPSPNRVLCVLCAGHLRRGPHRNLHQ